MSSIRKNFAYNVAYQLLLLVLPLITTPYISRVLGSGGLGTYTYTYTIANYFLLAGMLGVKNYGNRSIAAVREDKELLGRTFWEIYSLQFLCSAAALAVYLGYVFLSAGENRPIALLQAVFVLSGLLDISWFFFGLEKFRITVTRNVVIKLATLAAMFLFVRRREDLWIYTLIMALGTALSQGYLWFFVGKLAGWRRPPRKALGRHLVPELMLFVPILAVSLYTMMDKVMLGAMSGMAQVGYYEGASKILNIPMGVITALGTVMLPRMSSLAAKGQVRESGRYIRGSMVFAMFLASGMMFGIAGIAGGFVPLFLGREFSSCVSLIRWLAPTVPLIAWANVLRTQYLIPNHEDKSYLLSVALGAAVNLLVNALLIPRLQALGAVIGTLCAEGSVCLGQTVMVRKKLPVACYLKDSAVFFLFGGMMLAVILVLERAITNTAAALAAEICVGGGFYAALSALYYRRYLRKAF